MTAFKEWPNYTQFTDEEIQTFLREIANTRKDDISTIRNLSQVFLSGRKSGKIPVNSADVGQLDKVNDISWDVDFLYILVNNAGTGEWRRVALSAF